MIYLKWTLINKIAYSFVKDMKKIFRIKCVWKFVIKWTVLIIFNNYTGISCVGHL